MKKETKLTDNREQINVMSPDDELQQAYPTAKDIVIQSIITAAGGEQKEFVNMNVILTGDELLKHLNSQFLGIDEPTDVLAFDLRDTEDGIIEGDIYISLDRVKQQAESSGVTWENELARLVIHGFLHLCGYDHDDDEQLSAMIARGEQYIS